MAEAAKIPQRLGYLIASPKAYARQKTLLAGFRWLRSNLPVGKAEVEGFDPFWVVTKHADLLDISRRHDLFHNGCRSHTLVPRASDEVARKLTGGSANPIRTLVHMDEPDHSKYRRITQASFAQSKIKSLEARIRAIARASIDRMAAGGSCCDFVRDVAIHYPLHVLMRILGVPEEDEARMLKLTQELFASEDVDLGRGAAVPGDPARHARELFRLLGEYRDYFVPLMERRRREPADDLASVIATAEIDGAPINYFEAVSYYVIVAAAGHDTTSSSISGGVWALCENQAEFKRLKHDPGLLPNFVEEAIRWTTPVHHVMRTATSDTELRGCRIKKGDWLMLSYLSANRDDEVFDEPDRFRVDRHPSRSEAYARQKSLLAAFGQLRATNPLGRVEVDGFDPFWIVTKHADISGIMRQHNLFHNGDRSHTLVPRASDETARALTGGSSHPIRTLVHMDEPDHAKYRRVTQSWFTQQRIGSMEDRIRGIARTSIDRMAGHGSTCDFVRDVAIHFPLHVLMQILGVPEEDEPRILKLTQELFASEDRDLGRGEAAAGDPARHAKELFRLLGEFQAYFVPMMEQRRRDPQDDLASIIANATIDGEPMNYFEAVSYYVIVAAAGHDTTSSSISGGLWALCENPKVFQKVKAEPRFIPQFVEEAVRWTTPVNHIMRTATADVDLRGHRIAKGDWLMLCYLSANRDEEAFEQPDRFRLRRNISRSLIFGQGIHTCLGQYLARLEMQIFYEELLKRLALVEIAGTPRRSASIFIGGPKSLPIRYMLN